MATVAIHLSKASSTHENLISSVELLIMKQLTSRNFDPSDFGFRPRLCVASHQKLSQNICPRWPSGAVFGPQWDGPGFVFPPCVHLGCGQVLRFPPTKQNKHASLPSCPAHKYTWSWFHCRACETDCSWLWIIHFPMGLSQRVKRMNKNRKVFGSVYTIRPSTTSQQKDYLLWRYLFIWSQTQQKWHCQRVNNVLIILTVNLWQL